MLNLKIITILSLCNCIVYGEMNVDKNIIDSIGAIVESLASMNGFKANGSVTYYKNNNNEFIIRIKNAKNNSTIINTFIFISNNGARQPLSIKNIDESSSNSEVWIEYDSKKFFKLGTSIFSSTNPSGLE